MNISQVKKFAERPKDCIDVFVELGEKVEKTVNALNKVFEKEKRFLVDTTGQVSTVPRLYKVDLEPAGTDERSRHKITVWSNYYATADDNRTRCKHTWKNVDKGEQYVCTSNMWSNSVEVEQKFKDRPWGNKNSSLTGGVDRNFYQLGSWGNKKTLKKHDKIVEEILFRLGNKVKSIEGRYIKKRMDKLKIDVLDSLPFDTMNTESNWDKLRPRVIEGLPDGIVATATYKQTKDKFGASDKCFELDVNYEGLTQDELITWVAKLKA